MTNTQRIIEMEDFLKRAFYVDSCVYTRIDKLEGTGEQVTTFILKSENKTFKVCINVIHP